MIFKYPDNFMVLVDRVPLSLIMENIDLNRRCENKIRISQAVIDDFRVSKDIWFDIDRSYCECEAGYI